MTARDSLGYLKKFSSLTEADLLFLNETWEGGSIEAWNVVPSSACVNTWIVGSSLPYAGSYSAYVSSNGSTQVYTNSGSNTWCHLYKDILISQNIDLYWKCYGEGSADYGVIYLAPTTFTPVADTEVSSSYKIGSSYYSGQSNWTNANINTASYAGQSKRLIFSFKSDSGTNNAPGFCIDNIRVI
jgi:hypothetical protein